MQRVVGVLSMSQLPVPVRRHTNDIDSSANSDDPDRSGPAAIDDTADHPGTNHRILDAFSMKRESHLDHIGESVAVEGVDRLPWYRNENEFSLAPRSGTSDGYSTAIESACTQLHRWR